MKKVSGNVIKGEFCKILQSHLSRLFDLNVSLEKAYGIFKLCTLLPYHIATTQDKKVTLSGIGVFRTYKTNHTGTEIAKYYSSDTVQRILTLKQNLINYVMNPQVFRDPNGDPEALAEEKPVKKAPAKKVAKKTSAKKAEVEESVEEVVEEKPVKKAPAKKILTKKAPAKEVIEQELVDDIDDLDVDLDDFEL